MKLGFIPLLSEGNIFINKDRSIIICLYVDNIVIICPRIDNFNKFMLELKTSFNLKELGPINTYLGIKSIYNLKQKIM